MDEKAKQIELTHRQSPTSDDLEQLRQFVRVVDSMSRSRFMDEFRKQDHSLNCEGEVTGPTYDQNDFKAFLTDFRKIAMLTGEAVYLRKVLTTIGKLASTELRQALSPFYEDVMPMIEGRKTMMTLSYPVGDTKVRMSLQQVLSTLVNGEIFHVDPRHTQRARELQSRNELYYLWPALHYFVMPVVRGCIWLYHAIRHDSILGELDYPTPYPVDETVSQAG